MKNDSANEMSKWEKYGEEDGVANAIGLEPVRIAEDVYEICRKIEDKDDTKENEVKKIKEKIERNQTSELIRMINRALERDRIAERELALITLTRLREYERKKYNPMLSAEIEEEGNYNNIDGIVNGSSGLRNIKETVSEFNEKASCKDSGEYYQSSKKSQDEEERTR